MSTAAAQLTSARMQHPCTLTFSNESNIHVKRMTLPPTDCPSLDETQNPSDLITPFFLTPVREFLSLASSLGDRIFNRQRQSVLDETSSLSSSPATSDQFSPVSPFLQGPAADFSPTFSPQLSTTPTSCFSVSPTSAIIPTLPLSALDELVSTPRTTLSFKSNRPSYFTLFESEESPNFQFQLHTPSSTSSTSCSPSSSTTPTALQDSILKSPRGVLRCTVPLITTQNARMDLLLLQDTPTLEDIQKAAWNGCTPENRPQVWRMLVGYEPIVHSTRLPTLRTKRAQYRHFVRALYAPVGQVHFDCSSPVCTAHVDNLDVYNVDRDGYIDDFDFFVCTSNKHIQNGTGNLSNPWNSNSKTPDENLEVNDKQTLELRMDVRMQQQEEIFQGDGETEESLPEIRTHVIEYSNLSARTLRQIEMDLPRTHPSLPVFHVDPVRNAMRRILYTFGMINPNNNYVQGMNEIVTPILIVFLLEWLPRTVDRNISTFLRRRDLHGMFTMQQLADAEADAFWTFSAIVSAIGDNFIADQPGILRRVARLEEIVEQVDPDLMTHLSKNGNQFLQFAFRWMNCILMRELPFHLVVKLWDALLAKPDGISDLHVYVCAALLVRFSTELRSMDFEQCIMLLQRLPTESWTGDDVDELLSQASIWKDGLGFPPLAQ